MNLPTLRWRVQDILKINKNSPKRKRKNLVHWIWFCQRCKQKVEDDITAKSLPYQPFCPNCFDYQYNDKGERITYIDMDEDSWRHMGAHRDMAADGKYGMVKISKTHGTHPNDMEDWFNLPRGALGKRSGFHATDKQLKKIKDVWNKPIKL